MHVLQEAIRPEGKVGVSNQGQVSSGGREHEEDKEEDSKEAQAWRANANWKTKKKQPE